jgi:hypothetical protein
MQADFVIMGLPASGKTTFLAALWHLIGADETSCRLMLDQYKGDLEYLNRIAEAWRTFQPVPRTSQIGDVDVTIHLVDRDTGVRGTAFFPDLAGETFDTQVEARRCRSAFINDVDDDDGLLFFISADKKEDDLSVLELNNRLPGGRAGQGSAQSENAEEPQSSTEWEPKYVPGQVRVVQLLSDLLCSPFTPRRRRLAVLISAWDLATEMGLSPQQWVAAHMPLLEQFLRTNTESFEYVIYGVSAQGVRLEDEQAVDEAAKLLPSRRIQIVGPEGDGHDLTLPLVWLMSGAGTRD